MGKKSLVVDNDPVMLKWITHFLEKEGVEVLTGEDGLSALDILKTYRPDIIFTDVIMPNINGEKLCQNVRKDPDLKNIFLVVFSAVASEDEINLLQLGADLCIAKCSFDKMANHIRNALNELDRKAPVSRAEHVIGLSENHSRQITRELLSDRKHFEVILDSMIEGILEITPQGRIVYSNPSAISLVGISEEKLLASDLISLFHEGDRERMKGLLSTVSAQPKRVNVGPPLRLDGKEVSVNLIPVPDDENRTVILLLNDVSERKKLEAQLLHAQKMEAIGTLAGGIAHDFNNLLMVVQGNVALMLLDMNSSHPHYEMLKSVEKKVQNGSRLTSQLLGYARKGRYEVRPILLNQLVEETAEAFGRTRKNILIRMEPNRDLYPLEADASQMEQVLMNLLVNAADAMPEGGNIFLKTSNVTHSEIKSDLYEAVPGNYVLLSVMDTGIGMDEKTMQRIFDPFFTTKELGRGTGLGLASVYGIIKGHNGYINVRSEVGKGATFLIYLPASEEKVEEPTKKSGEILLGSGTVLLVDDEEHILDVGEKILKTLGYQVLIADSGEKAVEVYKKNRDQIELVILDLIMPRMGGGDTFDLLKGINPEVNALLSSGYSMNGQTMEIMRRGCKGFIQKPFSIKELSQKLREILDKK